MRKKKKRMTACVRVAVLVLTVTLGLSGCTTFDAFYRAFIDKSGETYETVKIGVFEPLSGKDRKFGELERIGIELAHELQPQCLAKDVELVYADNRSDLYVADEAMRELLEKKPSVILGSYGSAYSLVAGRYLADAQIPAIAISNTNPLVTSNNPYYFRVCFVDSYQGVALAKYTVESLATSHAAILKPASDDVAAALSSAFEDKLIQMTGDSNAIVTSLEYVAGADDYSDQLSAIKSSGVKTVFLPASESDGVKILQQAKEAGLSVRFLGTQVWDTESFAEKAGDAAGMAVFSSVYDADASVNSTTEVFLNAYREKYGEDATPEPAVALGFDAYMLAVESINRIGTARDGELLRESLTLTFQYPGASGNITLDGNGDPMKTVVVKGIINGKSQKIYTMEPALV